MCFDIEEIRFWIAKWTFFIFGRVFFFFFFLNPSFKKAMSERAGGRRASSQVNILVNFFQSYMLPLFFSGLLSYLGGMKRRTSRWFMCKRDNSYFLHC